MWKGYRIIIVPIEDTQKWRNWQTRTVQVRVVAIPCGFKSHLLHKKPKSKDFGFFISITLLLGAVCKEI